MSYLTQTPLNLRLASYIGRIRMDGSRLTKGKFRNLTRRLIEPVELTLNYDNIYYCCTQKTASQWFKSIFCDADFYRYSGFVVSPYQYLGLRYARIGGAFPPKTVVSHLYFNYQDYLKVPKPDKYKTFFILRDPRDIIVSWYFSAKYSHVLVPPIHTIRYNLERLDFDDGLKYIIDTQAEFGLFECQRSWIEAQKSNWAYKPLNLIQGTAPHETAKIFRYEDLSNNELNFVRDLFAFLEIKMPPKILESIVTKNTIKKLSKDQNSLDGDKKNHYRKGVSGDWQNHFSEPVKQHFYAITGDLIDVLGY